MRPNIDLLMSNTLVPISVVIITTILHSSSPCHIIGLSQNLSSHRSWKGDVPDPPDQIIFFQEGTD
jgi:hypothetical protein